VAAQPPDACIPLGHGPAVRAEGRRRARALAL